MLSERVVEPLDVVEHVGPGFFSRAVDGARAALRLQRREEALHCRVVPALAAAGHAACDVLTLEQLLEVVAGVLAALVRVVHQRRVLWGDRIFGAD